MGDEITTDEIIDLLKAAGIDTTNAHSGQSGGGVSTMIVGPFADEYSEYWDEIGTYGSVEIGPGMLRMGGPDVFTFDEMFVGSCVDPESGLGPHDGLVRNAEELVETVRAAVAATIARRAD